MENKNKEVLAIDGGEKSRTIVSKGMPKIDIEELMGLVNLWGFTAGAEPEIRKVLEKYWDGKSPHLFRYYHPAGISETRRFEQEFAEVFNSPYVLAVNSCTSALIAACVAVGVGPGTEVIVPAHTFFASASAVVVAKGIPVIAEMDDSNTLDPLDFERKITPATKAVIAVHMKGLPADMDAIVSIARKHNIFVIEDVAQAAGGWYNGRRLGTLGDIGCFSLDAYKVINSGEGGVMTFKDEWLYTRAQSYHDTAACWRPDRFGKERKEGELFAGENYRMSELQAAVARVQLKKMDRRIDKQIKNYRHIVAKLNLPEGIRPIKDNDPEGGCRTTMGILWPTKEIAQEASKVLVAEGIPGGTHDTEVRDWHVYKYWEHILEKKTATEEGCPYTCPYYKGRLPAYSTDMCPKTLDYLSRTTFIPVIPEMIEEECEQIAEGINKVAWAVSERFLKGKKDG
jgi:8-amino-3,8-dideoxy-alpha-D-manno-octulosonate transaminase